MSLKTPGVYIPVTESFPTQITVVPSSIPIFIGYTEKAENNGKSCANVPVCINSLAGYELYFGGAPVTNFKIELVTTGSFYDFGLEKRKFSLVPCSGNYLLYNAIKLFFLNGGGQCYILSIGDYNTPVDGNKIITALNKLQESNEMFDAALLLAPDAVLVNNVSQYGAIANAMLSFCSTSQSCFSILDVYNGTLSPDTTVISDFRKAMGENNLQWGAVYYPFLNTSFVSPSDISYTQIENLDVLNSLLESAIGKVSEIIEKVGAANTSSYLLQNSLNYSVIAKAAAAKLNALPPSSSIAGIYNLSDSTRGVWNAPANIKVEGITSPTVNITNEQQGTLLIDPNGGIPINAIRLFTGRGTIVWGARTMDAGNPECKYVSNQRNRIQIEQSIRLAMRGFVFEPNTAVTWISMKSMIVNYLTDVWKNGGLYGVNSSEAFTVEIGLGSSMTSEDILANILKANISLCLISPGEFTLFTIVQNQMS